MEGHGDIDHAIRQDRALVRAIEAPQTIEPSVWFERTLPRLRVLRRLHSHRE
jgi:hypothetical protein